MDIFGNINLDAIFEEVKRTSQIDYKDPMRAPWGDPDRNTRSQTRAWELLTKHDADLLRTKHDEVHGVVPVLLVAMIGAKGSGKTHLGAQFAVRQAQLYPGSLGCVISNTYTQAKDNAAPHLVLACAKLNLNVEFFQSKKVGGQPYASVFVIDLDGRGFDEGLNSFVLLRSYDAVNKLEGIELDWLWSEEGQDAEEKDFVTVWSRVRGQNARREVFFAAMPRDEFHWMYELLPKLGFIEEELFIEGTHQGIMLEPSLYENLKNVGEDYLERLRLAYGEQMAEWYIEGRRTSLGSNKVMYNYGDFIHRKGMAPRMLAGKLIEGPTGRHKISTGYDPETKLIFSFDFNVAPMSVSVWQEKLWNDLWTDLEWDDENKHWYRWEECDDGGEVAVEVDAPPVRTVLVQIDEFEVWGGGTEGTCRQIIEVYGPDGLGHSSGVIVVGDATGNRQDTRSSTTDWQIIQRYFRVFYECTVIQGLQQNHNLKTGEVKYSNPARRDTLNTCNRLLRDHEGKSQIFLMPESQYKSGGVAKSIAMATLKPDGNIDASPDRKEGRKVARLHFLDTFRYVCWWWKGGTGSLAPEDFDDLMRDLPSRTTVHERSSWRGLA